MAIKKAKTMNLGKGSQVIDYAKVAERVGEFHKASKKNKIHTSYEFKDGWVIFTAVVTPEFDVAERNYTGHSMGKITAVKAFEKLETIAVGRALAFAGYLSNGEIASSDEMEDFNDGKPVIETNEAIEKLKVVQSLDQLKKVWVSLSQAERDNKEILEFKELLKGNFPVEEKVTKTENHEDLQGSGAEVGGVAPAPEGEGDGNGAKKAPRKQNA